MGTANLPRGLIDYVLNDLAGASAPTAASVLGIVLSEGMGTANLSRGLIDYVIGRETTAYVPIRPAE
jgi:hypothetical protein